MNRRLYLMSTRAVTMLLAGLAATAVAAPAAQAGDAVPLAGTTIVHASRAGSIPVTLAQPASIRINPGGDTSPDISIQGNGRVAGITLSQPGSGVQGVSLVATEINMCFATGCTPKQPVQFVQPPTALTGTPTAGGLNLYVLPAGQYLLQVIADGAPVTATLSLGGLAGSTEVTADGPSDLRITDAAASTPSTPAGQPLYAAGGTGQLTGSAGIVFGLLSLDVQAAAASTYGGCTFQGPPTGGVYACPGGTVSNFQDLLITSPERITTYGVSTNAAGTWSQANYAATAGEVTRASGVDFWLSLDGPAPTSSLPEAPTYALLPAAAIGLAATWKVRANRSTVRSRTPVTI